MSDPVEEFVATLRPKPGAPPASVDPVEEFVATLRPKPGAPPKTPTRQEVKALAAQHGLRITSGYRDPAHNAAVGGASGSLHTQRDPQGQSLALDFGGDPAKMRAFSQALQRRFLGRPDLAEVIHGQIFLKNGRPVAPRTDHADHVHVAFREQAGPPAPNRPLPREVVAGPATLNPFTQSGRYDISRPRTALEHLGGFAAGIATPGAPDQAAKPRQDYIQGAQQGRYPYLRLSDDPKRRAQQLAEVNDIKDFIDTYQRQRVEPIRAEFIQLENELERRNLHAYDPAEYARQSARGRAAILNRMQAELQPGKLQAEARRRGIRLTDTQAAALAPIAAARRLELANDPALARSVLLGLGISAVGIAGGGIAEAAAAGPTAAVAGRIIPRLPAPLQRVAQSTAGQAAGRILSPVRAAGNAAGDASSQVLLDAADPTIATRDIPRRAGQAAISGAVLGAGLGVGGELLRVLRSRRARAPVPAPDSLAPSAPDADPSVPPSPDPIPPTTPTAPVQQVANPAHLVRRAAAAVAGKAPTVTTIRRQLRIDGARATSLMGDLERLGIVTPARKVGLTTRRNVLITDAAEVERLLTPPPAAAPAPSGPLTFAADSSLPDPAAAGETGSLTPPDPQTPPTEPLQPDPAPQATPRAPITGPLGAIPLYHSLQQNTVKRFPNLFRNAKTALGPDYPPPERVNELLDRHMTVDNHADLTALAAQGPIVFVPLSSSTGRNPLPLEIAERLAKQFGGKVADVLEVIDDSGESKNKSSAAKLSSPRRFRVTDADDLAGHQIVLVDDAIGTGETLVGGRRALRELGYDAQAAFGVSSAKAMIQDVDLDDLADTLTERIGGHRTRWRTLLTGALDGFTDSMAYRLKREVAASFVHSKRQLGKRGPEADAALANLAQFLNDYETSIRSQQGGALPGDAGGARRTQSPAAAGDAGREAQLGSGGELAVPGVVQLQPASQVRPAESGRTERAESQDPPTGPLNYTGSERGLTPRSPDEPGAAGRPASAVEAPAGELHATGNTADDYANGRSFPIDLLPNGQPLHHSQLRARLAERLNRAIRVVRRRGNIRGSYDPGSGLVAISRANDIRVVAHEIAHFIDDSVGLLGKATNAGLIEQSVYDLGKRQTGAAKNTARTGIEGVAEWIHLWAVNPAEALRIAPDFHKAWDEFVPEPIRAAVREYGDGIRAYAAADAITQSSLQVRLDAPTAAQRLSTWLKDLARSPMRRDVPFRTTARDRIVAQVIDDLAPVIRAIDYARQATGRIPLPSVNPEILLRNHASLNDKILSIFDRGMINLDGDHIPATKGGLENLLAPFRTGSAAEFRQDLRDAIIYMSSQRDLYHTTYRRPTELRDPTELKLPGAYDPADQAWSAYKKSLDAAVAAGKPVSRAGADAALGGAPTGYLPSDDGKAYLPPGSDTKIPAGSAERAAIEGSTFSGSGSVLRTDRDQAIRNFLEIRNDPARLRRARDAAARYRAWTNSVLDYLAESGRHSQESVDAIKKGNPFYIDWHRVVGQDQLPEPMGRTPGSRQISRDQKVIHRMLGSDLELENPYVNLMAQTYRAVREADRNRVMSTFTDLLTEPRSIYQGPDGPSQLHSVAYQVPTEQNGSMRVYRNGKEEHWVFESGVQEALARWGDTLQAGNVLDAALQATAAFSRNLITNTPGFASRNWIRDTSQRIIQTGSNPAEQVRLMRRAAAGEGVDELRIAGGGSAGMYFRDQTAYHSELKRRIEELTRSANVHVLDPSRLFQRWNDTIRKSEEFGRTSEYLRVRDKALADGMSPADARQLAAFHSRDLIDFAIAGRATRWLNRYIPFTSAAVAGLRAGARAAKRDPRGMALRTALYVALPSAMLYGATAARGRRELEEYRQLPAYRRDLFFNIRLGPDVWIAIPKPYEYAALSAGIERAIDHAAGNKNAWDDYAQGVWSTIMPIDQSSLSPAAVRPLVELALNRDFFRGRSIIPGYEEKLDVRLRDTTRASRVGQILQSATGVDARQLDHLFTGITGEAGHSVLAAADTAIGLVAPGSKPRPDPGLMVQRAAQAATGLIRQTPAGAAQDVQKADELLGRLGMGQSPQARAIREARRAHTLARSPSEREATARRLQKVGRRVREQLEAQQKELFAREMGRRRK